MEAINYASMFTGFGGYDLGASVAGYRQCRDTPHGAANSGEFMTIATLATNEIKMSADATKRWGENLDLSRTEMADRYVEKYGLGQFVALIGSQRAFIFDEYMDVIRHHAEAIKKEQGRYPEYLEWLGFVNPSVPLKIITPHSPQMRLF